MLKTPALKLPSWATRGGASGEESGGGYLFPIVTVAVPVGETQPPAEISVTESVIEPLLPAENVI